MATQRKLIPLSELELSTVRNVTTARKRRASDSKWADEILDRDHPLKSSTKVEREKAEEKKARNADITARWLNSKSGQKALQKNYEKNKMENSNMKYDHDKILAESASLTLSDLEQLQSAPGPVTEARKGEKGSPKRKFQDEDSASRKEEAQEHADDTAARDGGPYVARDIELGHDQGDIRDQGGSRQLKKKRGAKLKKLRSKGTK